MLNNDLMNVLVNQLQKAPSNMTSKEKVLMEAAAMSIAKAPIKNIAMTGLCFDCHFHDLLYIKSCV
jgi:hypothetical protein